MTRWIRRCGLAVAASAVVVAATASCGVPLDDEPRAIDRTTTTSTTSTPASDGGGRTMSVYFFNDEDLEDLQVPADDDPTVDDAINAVLAGTEAPLQTRIPTGTELIGFTLDGDTAEVDLSDGIEVVRGGTEKEAYAQLVFTALAWPQVRQVRFKVAGKAVKAPTDEGNLDVVTADDYEPPLNPR